MDLSEKESLSEENKKCCADCKTTKTPLWRSGPTGPKSLCNACGIRYRKKRNAVVGLNKGSEKRKEKQSTTTTTTSAAAAAAAAATTTNHHNSSSSSKKTSSVRDKEGNLSGVMRVRLMALGKEVVLLQRQRSPMKRQRSSRKLGEVEQAAFLLMALSCGSVFA